MIWRVIFCWLLATTLAHASFPRHSAFSKFSRLTGTALADHWGHVLDGYAYGLDTMGLRTNMTRQLGLATNSVSIGYDAISELTSWAGKETTGQPRWNEQIHYAYDAAGNMLYRSNNATVLSIGAYNNVNEPSDFDTLGYFTASGSLSAPATNVTINGYTAEIYSDLTFASTNIAIDFYETGSFTNIAENIYGQKATNQYEVTWGNPFDYNPDGSTLYASLTSIIYDEFGQASDIVTEDAAGYHETQLTWDGLGRCRSAQEYFLTNDVTGNWWFGPFNQIRYIYDGMTVVQERDSNNTPLVTYTRGLDLSGSLQGAGGIGGMLARTDSNGPAYYHADGNGNITALMDGNQRMVARYEYDPYGRLLGKWGRLGDANTYRFSSKQYFPNIGLYNFGFRLYMPEMGRWLNRDPIGEAGGINLYGFVGNNPVNVVDPYGLDFWQSQYSIVYQGPPISSYTGSDVANAVDELTSAAVQSTESTSTTGNFIVYNVQSVTGGLADLLRLGQGTADATAANNGWDQAIGIAQDVVRASGLFDLLGGLGADAIPKPKPKCTPTTPKPASCFAAGTKISTPIGDINIEDIKAGDVVYAYDFDKSTVVEEVVQKTYENFTYHWVEIEVDGETILATRMHPFWVEGRQQWLKAVDLKPGMGLRLRSGEIAAISSIKVRDLQHPASTFNFEVSHNHNYFVGNTHVLVHNGDGSYTITFASGGTYSGKGDAGRASQSANEISAQTGDPVVKIDWTPANGTADSFVQEEMRMRANNGPGGNTYNKINSPGNKIAAANGCP